MKVKGWIEVEDIKLRKVSALFLLCSKKQERHSVATSRCWAVHASSSSSLAPPVPKALSHLAIADHSFHVQITVLYGIISYLLCHLLPNRYWLLGRNALCKFDQKHSPLCL